MRVAVACFEYEGNSLSQKIDGKENFEKNTLSYGENLIEIVKNQQIAIAGGIDFLKKNNCKILPILIAKAGSGGKVKKEFYNEIKNQILNRIKQFLPLEGIFLSLHGAMICNQLNDPEGDLLLCIREIVGKNVTISTSLDLHAHVTKLMINNSDIIVGYETYPHEDAYSTGKKAAKLLLKSIKKEIIPTMKIQKLKAIFPVLGGSTNKGFPMYDIRAKARKFETYKSVESISYFPVQPWLDFEGVGVTILTITNNDFDLASKISIKLAKEMWSRRNDFELKSYSPKKAVKKAISCNFKTCILVDAADSIGGGAGGDSAAILKALVEDIPWIESTICIADPLSARKAFEIGLNNKSNFDIGGSIDKEYHAPFNIEAVVESYHDGVFKYNGGPLAGMIANLGPSAVLRKNGIQILLTTNAVYEHLDEHYRCCNIEFHSKKIVVFKNLMNFRKLINVDVGHMIVNGSGSTPLKLQNVNWENRKILFWPKRNFREIPLMDNYE